MNTNLHKFHVQRFQADKRGHAWYLTFEEWLDIWQQSGHFNNRGRGKGKYCMARYGDIGPYAVGNVYITLFEQNNKDQHVNNPSPSAKQVKTPLGIFESLKAAAKAHNVHPQTVRRNLYLKEGYEYV